MHWTSLTRALAAIFLATSIALGATMRPAAADQAAATRNTILGAALLVAGIATAVNVSHKNAQANAVTGYLPDGSTVYQDGHVVTPSGQSYYPGNYGQTVSCNGQACGIDGSGYNGNPYGSNDGYGYNGSNRRYAYGRR